MLKAILYKECLKTWRGWIALYCLNMAVMAYIAAETHHMFVMDHPEIVWYRVIYLGSLHFGAMKFLPIVTGTLLGTVQFLPEMRDERFRLSLHLPVEIYKVVMAHAVFGLCALGAIIGTDMSILAILTSHYFPMEAVAMSSWTAAPWCVAGFASYLGTTLGLLEPEYRLKAGLVSVAAGTAMLCLDGAYPGSYRTIMMELMLISGLLVPGILLPAYRFRFRRTSL